VVRDDGGGEAALSVDQVLGLRELEPSAVRPLPPLAVGLLSTAAVAGLVFLDDAPTPLIDLPTLIREQRQAAAHHARSCHA
jgi:chemotaxis signal transduction protein